MGPRHVIALAVTVTAEGDYYTGPDDLTRHVRMWVDDALDDRDDVTRVEISDTDVRAQAVREAAEKQRAHLRHQGYDLTCVCEGCTACLAREYIDLIDPQERP